MPKAKPIGFTTDTHTYTPKKPEGAQVGFEPYTCYRLLFNGECILESTSAQTRDYVLQRMLEREAEKGRELADISA
jgi:hypothetical protein